MRIQALSVKRARLLPDEKQIDVDRLPLTRSIYSELTGLELPDEMRRVERTTVPNLRTESER